MDGQTKAGVAAGRDNASTDKTAVCWLDVFLLIAFVFAGMVVWGGVERYIAWEHRFDEPLKETFEDDLKFPLRQAELTTAQDALKTAQTKLSEQQMEAARLSAEIKERSRSV